MQDLWFSAQTIFPLMVMMAVGFFAKTRGWITPTGIRQMNSCVFHVFLPILLCMNMMDMDVRAAVDGKTLLYAFVGSIVGFLLMFLLVPRFCKQRNACGVLIQVICRSNYAVFGIPLVMMMYPDRDTSVASMMVAVVVPVFNVMSTIALMIYGDHESDWKQVVKGVIFNPLILGTFAGLFLWLGKVHFPPVLESPLRSLGNVATPVALFMLGAAADASKVQTNTRLLVIGVLGRLVFIPLLFLPLGIALGIRDVSLITLVAAFASPVSVSSYPMAQQMGGDEDLAGAYVVVTTPVSVVTVFLWAFVLKSMGFLG